MKLVVLLQIIDLWLTGLIQFQWQDAKKNPLMSPVQQKRVYIARVITTALIAFDLILIEAAESSFTRFLPIQPILLITSKTIK